MNTLKSLNFAYIYDGLCSLYVKLSIWTDRVSRECTVSALKVTF
jgi:hypothetical protein